MFEVSDMVVIFLFIVHIRCMLFEFERVNFCVAYNIWVSCCV